MSYAAQAKPRAPKQMGPYRPPAARRGARMTFVTPARARRRPTLRMAARLQRRGYLQVSFWSFAVPPLNAHDGDVDGGLVKTTSPH